MCLHHVVAKNHGVLRKQMEYAPSLQEATNDVITCMSHLMLIKRMLVLTVTNPAIQLDYTSRKTVGQSKTKSKRSCGHGVSESQPPVRRRRSQKLQIDFKTHCFFCAEEFPNILRDISDSGSVRR